MSTDWTLGKSIRVAKRKKPPQEPRLLPWITRPVCVYVIITGIVRYLTENSSERFGQAAWTGLGLLFNCWNGWLWITWQRWTNYYKVSIPFDTYSRIWMWGISTFFIVYDIVKLVFGHKLPWQKW